MLYQKMQQLPTRRVATVTVTVEQVSVGYVGIVAGFAGGADATSHGNCKNTPEETLTSILARVEKLLRQQLKENV
jgi:hypothetical protein